MSFPKTIAFPAALFYLFLVNALGQPLRPQQPSQQVPVIGIVSTAGSERNDKNTYIKTTYVDFVEAGGAKVVPIPWDIDEERFDTLLDSVNGVLFTGGGAYLWEEEERGRRGRPDRKKYSDFQKRLNSVVELVKKKTKKGIHYPLFGIGQGFEAISIAVTEDVNVLDSFDHFGVSDKVNFTPLAAQSTMFQHFTQESLNFLQNYSVMYYWHEYGLNTSVPSLYSDLGPKKWDVTGISKDSNGKEFIATMESKEYPIYMVMFRPEKVLYESEKVPASTVPAGALYAVKLMAKSFITEAAKNSNKFDDQELLNDLFIENFEVKDLKGSGKYYIFSKNSLDSIWEPSSSGGGWFGFFVVVLIVVIVIGYLKYQEKQDQSQVHQGYTQFVDSVKNLIRRN